MKNPLNRIALIFFIVIATVSCKSVVNFQTKELYEINPVVNSNDINGFNAINIFRDDFDKSVWSSPEIKCVNLKSENQTVYEGKGALMVKWDKIAGGCKWVGIGFGWNNWAAKDITDITDVAAIQMQVKAVNSNFKNFPVAFALEDYSGVQCYYGFTLALASGEFNKNTWTSVTIPLSKFNFEGQDFDVEKVKQFMIQLEGEGEIYLDDIKIVRLQNG